MNTLSPGVTAGAETYMWHQVFRSQSTQEFAYISWIACCKMQNYHNRTPLLDASFANIGQRDTFEYVSAVAVNSPA